MMLELDRENEELSSEPDLQDRLNSFNSELRPLLGKYELGIAALPKILPDGRIAADPLLVSVRKKMDQEKEVDLPKSE